MIAAPHRATRLDVLGTTVDVWVDEPLGGVLVDSLADLHAPGRAGERADHDLVVSWNDPDWTVAWGDTTRYRGPDADLALYDSLIALNQHAAVTASASGAAVLHGGAVAIGGRAVAVVGHSGRGKSTFTTTMVRAGRPYLADEVVAVRDGVVQPFHRPIGLRRGGADVIGVAVPDGPFEHVYPYRAGVAGTLGGATPLALIVLLVRDESTPVARPEPLRPAPALAELANQTLGAVESARDMFGRLDDLVRRVPVCELRYSDVPSAEAAIVDTLTRSTSATAT